MNEEFVQKRVYPGDWVEVRPFYEIAATLDDQGTCEGLPFMPEMIAYCECLFRVYRRAEKVFLDRRNRVVRLKNMVLLEGVRCNGQSHDGCAMGCLILWNEAWLRPVVDHDATLVAEPPENACVNLPTRQGDRYVCQTTRLIDCGPTLPWWDFRQYVRDYSARVMTVREWISMLALLASNKLRRECGFQETGLIVGQSEKTSNADLNLQPDEIVQVRSREEIEATLDSHGRNRGLGFSPEMAALCNGRFRVLRRVERLIAEWSGTMHEVAGTVILDGATCTGLARRCCPRDCHYLWREIWLKRMECVR